MFTKLRGTPFPVENLRVQSTDVLVQGVHSHEPDLANVEHLVHCDWCADTIVQRPRVWRRSPAHDRQMQRSQMRQRIRYNEAIVTTILGYLLTNGHLVALVASAVYPFPSHLLEHSRLVNEQQWMLEAMC